MNLDDWLKHIATVHWETIAPGLDRVRQVAERLGVLVMDCPVIVVGGTNGKGTTIAALEAIYRQAGYRVGAFTSPCIVRINEQIRVSGKEASDEELCAAFTQIETARKETTLTPFEFQTLAAFLILKKANPDVLLLEIGMGGRLDAVNVIDGDVAIVTSIGLDHMEWLGSTVEDIGYEKAGIFRKDRPAICGDQNPPARLISSAKAIGAQYFAQGKAFQFEEKDSDWSWQRIEPVYTLSHLPYTGFITSNLSAALMAIMCLQERLSVADENVREGLKKIALRGRFEAHRGDVTTIFDVAHNPAAIKQMVEKLQKLNGSGKTHAVFSMLRDKDIESSLSAVSGMIDFWYVAPLQVPRGAPKEMLAQALKMNGVDIVCFTDTIHDAYLQARQHANPGDRILVFGSFHTVGEIFAREKELFMDK